MYGGLYTHCRLTHLIVAIAVHWLLHVRRWRIVVAVRRIGVIAQIKCRERPGNGFLKVSGKAKVSSTIQRIGNEFFVLFAGMIVVGRRLSSHAAQASFGDAPGPAEHLYSSAESSSQADFTRWRRNRPRGCFQIRDHQSIGIDRDLLVRLATFAPRCFVDRRRRRRLRFRICAQVVRLEGMEALVRAVVRCVVCKNVTDYNNKLKRDETSLIFLNLILLSYLFFC